MTAAARAVGHMAQIEPKCGKTPHASTVRIPEGGGSDLGHGKLLGGVRATTHTVLMDRKGSRRYAAVLGNSVPSSPIGHVWRDGAARCCARSIVTSLRQLWVRRLLPGG